MTAVNTHEDLAALRTRANDALLARLDVHLERRTWSAAQIADHQQLALRSLLRHAKDSSPFHARRLADVAPDTFTLAQLPSLPTMTKAEMLGSFDDLVTDRRLTRAIVEEHIAGVGETPNLLWGEYACMTSGGSSGERGIYVWTLDSLVEQLLAMSRSALADGLALSGGVPSEPLPYVRVVAPVAVHATRLFTELFTGRLFDLTPVSATLPIDEMVRRINEAQPLFLGGYPSVLTRLAEEKRAGRLLATPFAISGGSEPFTPDMKARVEAAFGVAPSDNFGSTEGLFGSSAPGEDALVMSTDIAIIELVDHDNQPVPPGTPSAKVLLTSLLNRVQPLIRYELTDSLTLLEPSPEHGYPRVTVEGRSDDELVWNEVVVHPIVVRSKLTHRAEILEYQVMQTTAGLDVAAVTTGPCDTDALAFELSVALEEAGLPAPHVTVRAVDSLQRHPQTGKVRRFVSFP